MIGGNFGRLVIGMRGGSRLRVEGVEIAGEFFGSYLEDEQKKDKNVHLNI